MSTGDGPAGACGCEGSTSAPTPASIENVAGRSSLVYRAGSHTSFKATMRAAMARQPALTGFTAGADDDPSIALLDAWASVLDVLTFYQERIANEGYLRTATEQRSILELARATGYELGPGVAASTFLAFTLDQTVGSPTTVTLEAGTKAQSIPGQNELPQIFETTETVEARTAWNALRPRAAQRIYPQTGTATLSLQGTSLNLKAGDALLIVGDERAQDPESSRWDFRRVKTFTAVPPSTPTADLNAGRTIVELDRGIGSASRKREAPKSNPKVYALRQRAALFGYNAPDWLVMSKEIRREYDGDLKSKQWPKFNIAYEDPVPRIVDRLHLDAVYPGISQGSWLVVSLGGTDELYAVTTVTEAAKTEFSMTAKTTSLGLSGANLHDIAESLRDVVVFANGELLEWADTPIADPVSGSSITLDAQVDGLASGHLLMAAGTSADTGESCSESVTLSRAEVRSGLTALILTTALQNNYVRETLIIYGNVARATNGESRIEILGSGDGSKPFQKFALKQKPLTFVSAATATGTLTTLEIRVNDILWKEVPALYGAGPSDRVYVTRLADDGTVTVTFGDGLTGARLPTGSENVTARYRVGSGTGGLVDAGQISLLMSRPLGLNSVTNPAAPSGAADAESVDQARRNSPLTMLTLERIVSLQDYEDFAQAFAGVGKAQATLLWNGERQMVHITVAGADGAAVDPASELHRNLRAAIDQARHVTHAVQVDSYRLLHFDVESKVLVDASHVTTKVIADVRAAVERAFAFEQRAFGQAVTRSELLSVLQGVEGVVAVDLDALYLAGGAKALTTALVAGRAHWDIAAVVPAELLIVRPDGILLTEMT